MPVPPDQPPPVSTPTAFRLSRALLALAALAAIALGTAALYQMHAFTAADRPDRPESLRIGFAIEAPYAFVDADGRVTGEGPEIVRAIAARLGIHDLVWRKTEFGALLRELQEGRVDLVAAGLFITPEREKQVAFSVPTFKAGSAMLVKQGNPLGLHSYEDVATRHARAGYLARSAEEDVLRRLEASPLVPLSDTLSGVLALQQDKADVFTLSSPSLRWILRQYPDAGLELAEPFTPPAEFAGGALGGVAFPLDNNGLRDRWNAELLRYLGSPEHLALVEKLGFTRAELPDTVTIDKDKH